MEKSSRRYTSEVYPAGEIDVCENLDVVHFWWLVASRDLMFVLSLVFPTTQWTADLSSKVNSPYVINF
jgi:hypothetical protein